MDENMNYATSILIGNLKESARKCNNAMRFGNVDGTIRALDEMIVINNEMALCPQTSRFSSVIEKRIESVNDYIGAIVFNEIGMNMENGGLIDGA